MKNNILIHIAFIALLSGCQTVVEVEIPDRPSQLVMNSLNSADSAWHITLSASKGILEPGELEPILTAKITIESSEGEVETIDQTTFTPTHEWPVYASANKIKQGITYTITAEVPGFNRAIGTAHVPKAVAIDKIDTASVLVDGIAATEVRITFSDKAETKDYYDIKLYAVSEIPFDTATGTFEPTTYITEIPYRIASESFFGSGSLVTAFEDLTFNGRQYAHVISFDDYYLNQFGFDTLAAFIPIKLVAELRTVSEAYYLYRVSSDTYQRTSFDPFAQPVQVYNNVEGGFGIIGAYSSSRDTLNF